VFIKTRTDLADNIPRFEYGIFQGNTNNIPHLTRMV